jgi:D-beta-D-heptose 7-phosphate kinase/D-beta-D-heptose 1-phosphate adenosyltransferase
VSLLSWVAKFPGVRVLVVGDALLDTYWEGDSQGLAREAPVPVVALTARRDVPGGAANLATNLAALGAQVDFLSVVGDDPEGQAVLAGLQARGVHTAHVRVVGERRTPVKRRVVAGEQIMLRLDEGSPAPLTPPEDSWLRAVLAQRYHEVDAVVISDYGYGVVSDATVALLAELRERSLGADLMAGANEPKRKHTRDEPPCDKDTGRAAIHPGPTLVIDAKSVLRYAPTHPTAVKPNGDEIRPLLPPPGPDTASRVAQVTAAADQLVALTNAHVVAVTLDREGAVVCERGRPPYRTYGQPTSAAQACGAGDSFTAGLTLALAAGADTTTAAELASTAASTVLDELGTTVCSAADLCEQLTSRENVEDLERVAMLVRLHQQAGRRVVFTNGCFDILHRGHVALLNRAKACGDVLVVGLNSDDSVRRLKGPDRPVNRLEDRAEVLAALSCVDHLVAFDDDTASHLLEVLRPDVYVKGGDYTPAMLPEAATVERIGATVQILPYLEDRSTTRIIERIRDRRPQTAGTAG